MRGGGGEIRTGLDVPQRIQRDKRAKPQTGHAEGEKQVDRHGRQTSRLLQLLHPPTTTPPNCPEERPLVMVAGGHDASLLALDVLSAHYSSFRHLSVHNTGVCGRSEGA